MKNKPKIREYINNQKIPTLKDLLNTHNKQVEEAAQDAYRKAAIATCKKIKDKQKKKQ